MKKLDSKKHTRERIFRQLFLYLYTDLLGKFWHLNKERRQKLKSKSDAIKYGRKTKVDLLGIMMFRSIPAHWFEVFYDLFTQGKWNLPLHEGISLYVDNYQIREKSFDKNLVKNSKSKSVSIEITGQVSPRELTNFINNNSDLINELTKLLNLPKVTYSKITNLEEGFIVHLMKEHKHLSNEKIAEKLTADYLIQGKNVNIDPNSVSKTAKEYQRHLHQKV